MNANERKHLLEIIRHTLNEDDGGGDYGGYSDYYGGGYGGGSSHSGPIANHPLMKAFVEPFVDVAKTAKMGVEKLAASTRRLVERLLNNVRFIVIPWEFRDFSENIVKREKAELASIEKKYSDVLKRTSDALENGHLPGFIFLANPVMYMTALVTAETLDVAAWFARTIIGSEHTQPRDQSTGTDDNKRARDSFIKKHPVLTATVAGATGAAVGHTAGRKKSKHTEKQLKQFKRLYSDDTFKKMVEQKMTRVSNDVKENINDVIDYHFKHINETLKKASTANGIKQLLDYDIEHELSKVPNDERESARQSLINVVHDALKIAYINSIKQHMKQYANVKEIKHAYAKLIKRIEAL